MLERVTLRGGAASILWGYRTAASVRSWTVRKTETSWTLVATVERADPFQCRQKPLLFTAPTEHGFWAWPVVSLRVGTSQLVAKLGPPEGG